MTLSSPDAIRTLQRKRYTKTKQEPGFHRLANGARLGVKNIGKPCTGPTGRKPI